MCLNGSPNAYDVDNHVETALDPSSILGVSSYIFRCVAQSGLGLLVWGQKIGGSNPSSPINSLVATEEYSCTETDPNNVILL